jgi:hypothetical protein
MRVCEQPRPEAQSKLARASRGSFACGRRVERETVRASLHEAIFKLRSVAQRKEQTQTSKGQQDTDDHSNHKQATRIEIFVALRLFFSHMSVPVNRSTRESKWKGFDRMTLTARLTNPNATFV